MAVVAPQARALARLRDPSGALAFAGLFVEHGLHTPLREIAAPAWIASQLGATLEALSGDGVRTLVLARLAEETAAHASDPRPLKTWLPAELEPPLRAALARPWSPRPEQVMQVLDQDVVRDLVIDVLTDALTRFGKRLRATDGKFLGGIGGESARAAVKKGRGILGNLVSDLASETLVGAVAEEFEASFHRRVTDFVGRSVQETLRHAAVHLSNPAHAAAYGDLRLVVFDAVMAAPLSEIKENADQLELEGLLEGALDALGALARRPDFLAETEVRVAAVMERVGDGTLGDWLDEAGLLDDWRDAMVDWLADRLGAFFATDEFAHWWGTLFRDDPPR